MTSDFRWHRIFHQCFYVVESLCFGSGIDTFIANTSIGWVSWKVLLHNEAMLIKAAEIAVNYQQSAEHRANTEVRDIHLFSAINS